MKKRFILLLLVFSFGILKSFGQTVTGLVTDTENGALPGVNVQLKGTNSGTITDLDGKYKIEAKNGDILVFSFIGMQTQSITVNSEVHNITMDSDEKALDEVVVVGYGTMRKSDLTGSVGSLKKDVIEKTSSTSISQALQGKVSGVNIVSNDGSPGGGVTIRIRGGNTLTGGSQPLFVIDGLPFTPSDDDVEFNPLGDINPSDIESVEILKDASATAIYGAQGANGVIMVTTKKGQAGKPRVQVNGYYGLSEVSKNIKMLTPEEYVYSNQARWETRFGGDPTAINPWDQRIADEIWKQNPTIWTDHVLQVAEQYNTNVSFSGGDKGFLYSASVGLHNEEGIIVKSDYKRMTGRINLSQEVNDKLKLSLNGSYSKSQNNGMINDWTQSNAIVQALTLNPFVPLDDPFGDNFDDDKSFWGMQNPYTYIQDVDFKKDFDRMTGRVSLDYKIINGLSFFTAVGGNKELREFSRFWPSTTRQGLETNGRATLDNQKISNWVYESRLNYNKTFGSHKLNAVGVFEAKGFKNKMLSIESTNMELESLGIYAIGSTTLPAAPQNWITESQMVSGLGRINYSYGNKYLLTLSLRSDASSKFGAGNKWGYFPSAAMAWRVTEESFMKKLGSVSDLKIRGSYGVTGNDQIPTYQSLVLLNQSKYNFGESTVVGLQPARLQNDDLKWETTTQYNVGFDLGLFDNRITLTADAYLKKTTDLLLEVELPSTSGFTNGLKNVGELQNKGLEFSLNTVNFDGEFSWSTSFNISFNRSEVLNLGESYEMFWNRGFVRVQRDVMLRVGEPVGIYYGYIEDGVYNTEEEVLNSPDSKISDKAIGEVRFADINQDGVINESDRMPIGYTQPKHTGGIGNSFSYKGFDLYAFIRWSYGNDIVNANTTFATMTRISNNILGDLYNQQWSPETPENNYRGYMNQSHENVLRSEMIEDGSFLRLDNLVLGYSLPQKYLSKAKIRKLRVYASVRNLYTLTRYSWYDPEVSTGWGTVAKVGPGADMGSYPRPRTFLFGVEFGF